MDRTIIVALAAALLASCQFELPVARGAFEGIPSVASLDEAWRESAAIDFDGGSVSWQTPEETFERGTGDCEDFAIYLGAMLYNIGYESELIFTTMYGGPHCVLYVAGVGYLEPQVVGLYYASVTVDSRVELGYAIAKARRQ